MKMCGRATRKADGIAVALKKVSAQIVDDKSRTKCLKEVNEPSEVVALWTDSGES